MELIKERLICGITRVIPTSPADLPCGHIFEMASIYQWFVVTCDDIGKSHCPNCRHEFVRDDIHLSLFTLYIINVINNNTVNEVSVQTDLTLDTEEYRTLTVQYQSVDLVSNEFGQAGSNENEFTPREQHRVVDYSEPYNSQSSNSFLAPHVRIRNQDFLRTIFGEPFTCYLLPIKRYMYQHSSLDLIVVSKHLIINGYFVFDLFVHKTRHGVQNYVILTTPYKLNKELHHLCELTH